VERICPRCRVGVSPSDTFCATCGFDLRQSVGAIAASLATSSVDATRAPPLSPAPEVSTVVLPDEREVAHDSSSGATSDRFQGGDVFGQRYHIIRLLAVGGMGAVYQAWDNELGVAVAIKTIRPDALGDGTHALEAERRFKRELVLARQVTHENVLRIHDLGEVNGLKYITMPFVDGRDLAAVLKAEGRLPIARALHLFRQIVAGVRAAHARQIVHRDLKPANILLDGDHVFVVDFGIARANDGGTMMTLAGNVVGTMDYMAPEQAHGRPVDQRADIYALGLILRDMLAGRGSRPQTDNALTDLMQRLQQPLPPIRTIDPAVPERLEAIISRCTAIDPAERFQTTDELHEALSTLDASGLLRPASSATHVAAAAVAEPASRLWITRAAVALLVVIAVAGGWFLATRNSTPVVSTREPVSVLIANFDNRTGDAVFDGALEQVLGIGIEGARFITAYPRDQALRVVNEIAPKRPLDEEHARLVSVREGIRLVLAGSIEPNGAAYRISVRALDGTTGAQVAGSEENARDKSDIIDAVGRVAKSLRSDLGDATVSDGDSSRETFTTASIEAAQAYARGQDLAGRGQFGDAIIAYQEALEQDPSFGRAYSGWASAAYFLGRPEEADGLFKKALSLMERMNEREKYRTLGAYYLGPGANDEEAIANFRALIEKYPSDAIGFNNLSVAYFNVQDFRQAVEHGRKVVEIFPRYVTARTNLALYMMYASDLPAAVAEARKALDVGQVDKAYLPIAVAALAEGNEAEALRAYDAMAKVGARGAAIASMGQADVALHRGDDETAGAILERGAAADEAGNRRAPHAMKLVALAEIAHSRGDRASASRLVDAALKVSRPDSVLLQSALLMIALDRHAEAAAIAGELEQQVRKRRRALGAVIRAELARDAGRTLEAIDRLIAARNLADLWLVRYALGRTYVEAGRYAEAVTELEACRARIGEGGSAYHDDWPTLRYTAPVSYWLARAQQELGLEQSAKKNYEAYLAVRGHADDPLAADARKRITLP
jgi:tetratricopeptide (TPR) repeat protein